MQTFTLEEVAQHDSVGDLWMIVDGNVYDLTTFLARHPGGPALVPYAGKDASDVFGAIHRAGVLSRVGAKYKIGIVSHADIENIVEKKTKTRSSVRRRKSSKASRKRSKKKTSSYYSVEKDEEGYDKRKSTDPSREFGDHMAHEGVTSHIPTVILTMYLALALWSYLAVITTGCAWYTIFLYYVAAMIAFYLWHLMAHATWTGEMNQVHMGHHLIRFPPSDFYGSAELYASMYPNGKPTIWSLLDFTKTTHVLDAIVDKDAGEKVDAQKANEGTTPLVHEGPLILFMILIFLTGYFVIGTAGSTLGFVAVLFFVMVSLGNALHMSFHVRGFHLEKYAWYMELRSLHYIHHLGDMKSNMAMLNLGMDGFFGSLAVVDPVRAGKHQSTRSPYAQLVKGKTDADFPVGISRESIMSASAHAGATATILGLDVPLDQSASRRRSSGYPTVLLRIVLLVSGLALWFETENYARSFLETHQTSLASTTLDLDLGHEFFWGLREWLLEGEGSPRAVLACNVSQLISELIVGAIILSSMLGRSFRPALAVIIVFVMRLSMRILGATQVVPPMPNLLWLATSDIPRLFVPTGMAAHLFFSGRVAITAIASLELLAIVLYPKEFGHDEKYWVKMFLVLSSLTLLGGQIALTLAMQASWSFDVIVALVFARYATIAANRASRFVDAFMP